MIFLQILAFWIPLTYVSSEFARIRRVVDLRKSFGSISGEIPSKYMLTPSKVFCNGSEIQLGSPISLGGYITNQFGGDRESALRQLQGGLINGQSDSSMYYPMTQTLRFNKRFVKTRDLIYFKNDGEKLTFQFSDEETSDATVRGQNWDDEYVFAKGQFQWAQLKDFLGLVGGVGHQVNNRNYPVEMELIHYKKSSGSLKSAWDKNETLIISIMLTLTTDGEPELSKLLDNIPYVAQPGPLKLLHAPVNFGKLLPLSDSYFEYTGSYTFTPCYENVRRIVFQSPISIDEEQLLKFQHLLFDGRQIMQNNFQTLQDLKGRKVNYYESGYTISTREKLDLVEKPSHIHGIIKRKQFVGAGE